MVKFYRGETMPYQEYLQTIWTSGLEHGPKIIAALVIAIIAYIVARIVKWVATKAINSTVLGKNEEGQITGTGESIGKALFWIVILVALPAILGALGMQGLLAPVQDMANKFLTFLPKVIGAGFIVFVGWIVATVVKQAVTSILQAARFETVSEKLGLSKITGGSGLSKSIGMILFTLVLIPVLIAGIDTLGIDAVSAPAKSMLQSILTAIPLVFAACLILGIAYAVALAASTLISSTLPGFGFDNILSKAGLKLGFDDSKYTPSAIVSRIAFIAVMLFGAIEAANVLQFEALSNTLGTLMGLGGRILLGTVIIAFGVVIANVLKGIIGGTSSPAVASLVWFAIVLIASAMGLRQMGLANEIITMGFSLFMGALALGAAIAIGLGAKEPAGKAVETWLKQFSN